MSENFNLDGSSIRYAKKDVQKAYLNIPRPKSKNVKSDEFFSNSPPSVFVGSKLKYPSVNVGILAPPEHVEDVEIYDSHNRWVQEKIPINEILKYRGNLINSRFQSNVHCARGNIGGKFFDVAQELGMAKKSVDVEFQLNKKIKLKLDFDKVAKPIGGKAYLKDVNITENVKIYKPIDKVFCDTDLKASDALKYLYSKNIGDQSLSQLFSLGTMGLGKNRRLVSTRWSITAVDDIIGKNLIKELKEYDSISDYSLFYGNFLGNYYLVFLFPDVFSYELFEMYLPGCSWNPTNEITVSTDYENYYGRKDYADNCAGGYYAARLPLLEYLKNLKKQSSCLVLRFETPDYWASLGVFVVREAMKKTMNSHRMNFDNMEKMIDFGKNIIKTELNFNADLILSKSKLLRSLKAQTKLTKFFV